MAGAGLAAWWAVDPAQLPVSWLLPVREGSTEVQVRIARGEGAGLGIAYTKGYLPWLSGGQRSLDALVRVQLAFGAGALVALVALGRRVVGLPVALLVAAAWATSLPVRTAVLGGGPAPGLWLALLVAGVGLAGWWRGAGAARRGGLALAAGAGALAGLGRAEAAAWVAIPAGLAVAHRAGWGRRLADGARSRPGRWLAGALAVLVVGALTHGVAARSVGSLGRAGWAVHALHPLDPSTVTLVPVLASAWPVGLVLLAVVGALRAPVRNLGLGIAAFLAFRVYHAAGHGGFVGSGDRAWPLEMVRYGELLAPALAALAWWGWERVPRGPARAIAAALLLVPGHGALWPPWADGARGAPMWGSTWTSPDVDAQREVRLLVGTMREHAACGIVAAGAPQGEGRRWLAWRPTQGGARGAEARLVTVSGRLEDAVDALPGAPSCVLLFTGLACAHPGAACDDVTAGLEEVWRVRAPAAPHAHPEHGWGTGDEVIWTLWRVR